MKTRVLHVVPNMNVGGLETFIMNVYRNIDRDKIQFDFLEHYLEPSVYDEEIERLGGKIYHFSLRNDNNIFKYIIELNKFFKEHKEYKIVHCHMSSINAILFVVAKFHGIKIRIAHSHNTTTEKTVKGFIKKICASFVKYTSTVNFACSSEAGEYLFGKKGYTVIPNAINLDDFKFDIKAREKIKTELGIENKTVIGHVGRFSLQKNHEFLIDLFYNYQLENHDSVLVLVGTGELLEQIKDKVRKLGIEDKVLFLGVRKDVNKLYSAFDIFVFPSLFEGLPLTLIEAQASGIHTIASDSISKECIISNNIVFVSINEDVSKWVNSIDNALKNSSRNVLFNENKDKFDIKILVKKLEKIYRMEG